MVKYVTYTLVAALSAMGHLSSAAAATEDGQIFASLYGGRYSDTPFIENLLFDHDLDSSDIYVLSVGKTIAGIGDAIAVEVEGQVGFHNGRQTHQEINGVLPLRWLPFPWDRYLGASPLETGSPMHPSIQL